MGSSRFERFAIPVPVGSFPDPPVTVDCTFPSATVNRIRLQFPRGCNGLVGAQINYSGQTYIPYQSDQWLKADDYEFIFDCEGVPNGGAWSITAGSDDLVSGHTLYATFEVSEVGSGGITVGPGSDGSPVVATLNLGVTADDNPVNIATPATGVGATIAMAAAGVNDPGLDIFGSANAAELAATDLALILDDPHPFALRHAQALRSIARARVPGMRSPRPTGVPVAS